MKGADKIAAITNFPKKFLELWSLLVNFQALIFYLLFGPRYII